MKKYITDRVEKLCAAMEAEGADAFVVLNDEDSNWESLFYLSGFRGTSGALVVWNGSSELILDSRYCEQGRDQSPLEVAPQRASLAEDILELLALLGAERVLCEADKTSHAEWSRFAAGGAEWLDGTETVRKLRRPKDSWEVQCIRKSADIASAAFLEAVADFRPGMTEKEFEAGLNYRIALAGGEAGFDMIVASGPRSSMPHGRATEKPIVSGEWVTVDYGARWNGYFCDITRNFYVGEPDLKAAELHDLLKRAHDTAAAMLRAGVSGTEVHNAALAVLNERDMGKYFTHSLGHGFGLEIHESPLLSPRRNDVLRVGDIVTIEPGVYIEGWGGMRLEDDYIIGEDGAELLTGALNQCFYRAGTE